jgi:Fe-S-cluster containining protein
MANFECKRCGWCCEHIKIPIFNSRFLKQDIEWFATRKIEIKNGYMIIWSPCQFLNYDLKFNAVCMIQKRKPVKCRLAGCQKI